MTLLKTICVSIVFWALPVLHEKIPIIIGGVVGTIALVAFAIELLIPFLMEALDLKIPQEDVRHTLLWIIELIRANGHTLVSGDIIRLIKFCSS